MHPDGSVAIMDRSKDIIISGGEVCVQHYNEAPLIIVLRL